MARENILLSCAALSAASENDSRPLYMEVSLDDYIQQHPQYTQGRFQRFFSKMLSSAHKESLLKKHVITYADYQSLVERAKQTKFGLLILSIGDKKIVFTANKSVQDELVRLETGSENKYTTRVLQTGSNHRLLENNPVAANTLDHEHNYIREQENFFSTIAKSKTFSDYVKGVFPEASSLPTAITSNECMMLVRKCFSQLYFQALFSRSDYRDPNSGFTDPDIVARIETHHEKIYKLYEEIEACTGKHGLTFGKLLGLATPSSPSEDQGDTRLIPLLYEVICCIYAEDKSSEITAEIAIAEEIIRLMQKHGARVLPVFAKLPNATNQCFNLLSWLDNSLNIINTLSNCIVHISQNRPAGELTSTHIMSLLPEMRALATLFMREINPDTQVTLSFSGYSETIQMGDNYRVMMTNAMSGAVFGTAARTCPSRNFSFRVIFDFIPCFFKNYILASPYQKPSSATQNDSWFWNLFNPSDKLEMQLSQLSTYISRIESYKSETGINYQHGFWHHKQSRAINREGNYLLAKALKSMLEQTGALDGVYGSHGSKVTSKDTHTLKAAILVYREALMRNTARLEKHPDWNTAISRGINSSDLNTALSRCSL